MFSDRTQLFVYGTLKQGDVRAYLLEGQRFLGEACAEPAYRLFNTGDYPALVEAAPLGLEGTSIIGELWAVDQACLTRLDEEEGVEEGLYERRLIQLVDQTDSVQSYFYLPSVAGMGDCGQAWQVDRA